MNQAFDVMKIDKTNGKVNYNGEEMVQHVDVPEFHTTKYSIHNSLNIQAPTDHFLILIAVKGLGKIVYENNEEVFSAGETVLIPAGVKVILSSEEEGLEYLETYTR